jgi:hypothetical protein
MQQPPVSTRVVPANALFHFALPQREYAATLAAVGYFARKLQMPGERLVAESALTWLQNISGMTLPSEAGTGGEEIGKPSVGAQIEGEAASSGAVARESVPKGLEIFSRKVLPDVG